MDVKNLIPWSRNRNNAVTNRENAGHPLAVFHREMNQLLDDFFEGLDSPLSTVGKRNIDWSTRWPRVEVSDTAKEFKITAELPGMDEKDIDVTLEDGTLILRGDKKTESEGSNYSERYYGRFYRAFHLGNDIDADKVNAKFKNGVLTINIEKKPETLRSAKRIQISG